MHPKRRSGRIAKEVPIVLLGTDTTGKVFAEATKTVVLSRHGAGVLSKYRFAPDEVLTLRLSDRTKEAEVRLVGQIGGEPGRYVYGLAFVDPNLDFWPMEFPPPEPFRTPEAQLTLECMTCHEREAVEPSEIEEDVYSINGSVLRFCPACGTSTSWTKAHRNGMPGRSKAVRGSSTASSLAPAVSAAESDEAAARLPRAMEPTTRYERPGAYSAAALETVATASTDLAEREAVRHSTAPREASASVTDSLTRPSDPQGRPVNRRKHMRVRVNFSACIKEPLGAPDVVECANMSKGGLCFHSRKRYAVGSTIEIAAPFSPGTPALFVPARIQRAEPLGDGQFFRYGVAYIEKKS